jgi:hypothetical protein
MTSSQPVASNRRYSYRRGSRKDTRIACHLGTSAVGDNLAVALLDASQTGVRLLVQKGLDRGAEVFLIFQGAGCPPVERRGTVVWAVPGADGAWCVGIHLRDRLAYAALIRLTEL